MTNAVELAQALIRFDTINPPGAEQPCAEHIGRLMEQAGYDIAYHRMGDGRASLVARLDGGGERPPLCFTGHVDVVPLGLRPWSVEPFAAEIKDGKLYGRGSTDMKGGVAAFVAMALELAKLPRGRAGLVLVITAGEETGCDGAYHLARTAGALGEAGAIVVAEPTSNSTYIGHKGALWVELEAHGVTAHGSMPERGDNALYKAARAVGKLEDFGFNIKPDPLLGSPSLNVGRMAGGINVNSVPDHATIGVDIRTVPGQRHDEIVETLKSYLGSDIATLSAIVDVPAVASDPKDPWVLEVAQLAAAVTGGSTELKTAPYFTDASVLTPAYGGVPTVVLGPGELAMAHQTDEYCHVERIEQAADIYGRIARSWCGK